MTLWVYAPEGLYVHLQEFKTVHTATGICQTDTAVASSRLYIQQQAYVKQILFDSYMYGLELLMMDEKSVRNM